MAGANVPSNLPRLANEPVPGLAAESDDDIAGARAIEVAAMLGESVVGVKHLTNPEGGTLSSLTKGLFVGGALLILVSVFAFAKGVDNAALNQQARRVWIEELHKPAHDFRPRRIGLVYDWMAFGGALAGLFALTYGLARLREERDSPWFRIGSAPDVEFPVEGAPGASFPLVAPLGKDFVCNFVAGMDGELVAARGADGRADRRIDGQPLKLADLQASGKAQPSSRVAGAMQTAIPMQGRIKVSVGQNTFLISSVPRPRRHAMPLFASMESKVLAFVGGSAVAHLAMVILLLSLPPAPRSLSLDLQGSQARLVRVQSKAQEDPKAEHEEGSQSDGAPGGTGTAMALDPGKMGNEDSQRTSGRYAMKHEGADPQLAREEAIQQAREAGFLGAIRAAQGGAFVSITAAGDFSSGLDDANVYGGLMGNAVAEMQGGFGFSRSGFGPGGGGPGWGTMGTGRYGTIGQGPGTGSGYDAGPGRGDMRRRRAVGPRVDIGNAVATGDLDKNIIRRYIRQKLPRIEHCYEKQLLVKPDISGTVVTQFQISPQGAVLGATAQGVDNEVSGCVAGVIETILFPKPRGGGLVQVRYPFTFRPAGG